VGRQLAGRPKNTSQPANNFSPYRETLEEAEIGRDKAARWQQVAAIPEEKFSPYIQTNKEKGKELTTAGAPGAVVRHSSEFCTRCELNAHGRIRRSSAARRPFQSSHPCPATGLPTGACPGFVVDHIVPLKRGGPDDPSNMQWQTVEEAKAKDRSEWYSVSCLITFGTVDAPESDAGER
jgi:hypothetical protein